MNRVRLSATAAGLLLLASAAGCGDETAPDAAEWGTPATPGATGSVDPSGSPTESPTAEDGLPEGVDLAGGTIAQSALSEEQADLYEDMLLFEEPAKTKVEQSAGGGASGGDFLDSKIGGDGLAKPDGILVATEYQMQWDGGKVSSYSLETETGEIMIWDAGKILLLHPIDPPVDSALEQDLAQVSEAIDDWVAEHGERPSVSDELGDVVLDKGLFEESGEDRVTIEMGDSVDYKAFEFVGDDFMVKFESDETGERAVLTQDGTAFSTPLEVV